MQVPATSLTKSIKHTSMSCDLTCYSSKSFVYRKSRDGLPKYTTNAVASCLQLLVAYTINLIFISQKVRDKRVKGKTMFIHKLLLIVLYDHPSKSSSYY